MTHEYTIIVDATILPGAGLATAEAIAWAAGTVIAVGTNAQVQGISRGDSLVVSLGGMFVVPLGGPDEPIWPSSATLEVGGPADFAALLDDPRAAGTGEPRVLGVVRGGHVVHGSLDRLGVAGRRGAAVDRDRRH